MIIHAVDLKKSYGDLVAVDGITFDVAPNECFGLLGPNGAGKSTTVKMLFAFSPRSSGTLDVFGLDIWRHGKTIKRRLGVVSQDDNLDPDLTVRENLLVYARYFGIPSKEAVKRAAELLDFMQLAEKADKKVPELSGGMKRRLTIARALINGPELVILDEPTTGLDPQARHLVWTRLRALKKQGATLVLTTHYMEEAAQLCDRLCVMDKGKIIALGTPADLVLEHAGREVVEIRGPAIEEETARMSLLDAVAPHVTRFDHSGDTLFLYVAGDARPILDVLSIGGGARVLHRQASLEDVFLKLTGRDLRSTQ